MLVKHSEDEYITMANVIHTYTHMYKDRQADSISIMQSLQKMDPVYRNVAALNSDSKAMLYVHL